MDVKGIAAARAAVIRVCWYSFLVVNKCAANAIKTSARHVISSADFRLVSSMTLNAP